MTRINQRLRVGGAGVFQSAAKADKPLDAALSRRALDLLGQGTHDWIPGAARVSAARPWDGLRLLSADGLPVVGATRIRGFSSTRRMVRQAGASRAGLLKWSRISSPASRPIFPPTRSRRWHRTLLTRDIADAGAATARRCEAGLPLDRSRAAMTASARTPLAYFTPKDDALALLTLARAAHARSARRRRAAAAHADGARGRGRRAVSSRPDHAFPEPARGPCGSPPVRATTAAMRS